MNDPSTRPRIAFLQSPSRTHLSNFSDHLLREAQVWNWSKKNRPAESGEASLDQEGLDLEQSRVPEEGAGLGQGGEDSSRLISYQDHQK
jgi:hypothetical protein